MIVLDASVALRILNDRDELTSHVALLANHGGDEIHAPAHFAVEVLNALRGLMLRGHFTFTEFTDRAALVARFPVYLHDARDSVARIAELAHNATPYDAAYLALAERLDCPLVTCDTKLADIPGTRAKVLIL